MVLECASPLSSMTSRVPLSGQGSMISQMELRVEGHEPLPGAPIPRAQFRVVSSDYFRTMGVEVLRGRPFTITDEDEAAEVVIINETLARTYFGERDPVGQRLAWTDDTMRFMGEGTDYRTIVGVVADTRTAASTPRSSRPCTTRTGRSRRSSRGPWCCG